MYKKGNIAIFAVIMIATILLAVFTTPWVVKNTNLGLDLKGGFEVLYEVQPLEDGDVIDQSAMNATVRAINNRVNVLGVSEPDIRIEDENRIRVQLAGVSNQNDAREVLSSTAQLTFRDIDDNVLLDGKDLAPRGAAISYDQQGNPVVELTLQSADQFGEVTSQIAERPAPENRLVIWLDFEEGDSYEEEIQKENSKIVSDASVNGPILSDKAIISGGDIDAESGQRLADILNAGALPVKLEEIYSTSVSAQFGQDALDKTVFASLIGIAAVFLFMLFFYRLPGLVSIITLVLYINLIMLFFNGINAVLTLPGIAALVLGVGMAVDANIITAERIKDELRSGKSVLSAFRAGNRRSLSTIIDANLTTLISAAVLFYFGTSSVRGFAIMLMISIAMTFISNVFISRYLMHLLVASRLFDKRKGWFGVKESEIREL
ncbi:MULTISPECIES: protein translocase subunit SecD [unclassified Exiguobacterium]|uniref:protein translocase subunit SecD n=1 Tax=unclassified Exiguobacterium TaxID=2644629 RepID=UPI00103D972C|nr:MULTISPECIES: protein translocase subunit SecD [unclassified Exiguobacterium]TCI45881.1 protein translocase subunit SecD [Exiguobacterium sp. SH5S32]TCI51638.1 protein translocase subunit SecD [Exiguobacterium sp. SH1S4]TCI65655.1 protein translocase subunit SecD [Exiguobacterium sp. SH0S2]TCI71624.1 protein translocase subunit SecD [Exiguobacterium sp. SH1S1]